MARDTLGWVGNHRGALAIAHQLSPSTLKRYAPTVLLADPKENRAEMFSEFLRKQFPTLTLTPKPIAMRAQEVLSARGDLDAVVLSVDTPGDTIAALNTRRPSQRMTFQICGRGPSGASGTRLALQGTLAPGDHETQKSVSLLLPALSDMSRAASSRELTDPDAISALVLAPLRKSASSQSALHLSEKEREPRDLSGSPMSVFFGQTAYPLIAVEGGTREKYSQQTALALESAGE